jgi:hypothetical protein
MPIYSRLSLWHKKSQKVGIISASRVFYLRVNKRHFMSGQISGIFFKKRLGKKQFRITILGASSGACGPSRSHLDEESAPPGPENAIVLS